MLSFSFGFFVELTDFVFLSPGWSPTCYVAQEDLTPDRPTSISQLLWLQACATTCSCLLYVYNSNKNEKEKNRPNKLINCPLSLMFWTGMMIHRVKVLYTKPNNLNSIPGIHLGEVDNSYKLFSDLNTNTEAYECSFMYIVHTYTCAYTHNISVLYVISSPTTKRFWIYFRYINNCWKEVMYKNRLPQRITLNNNHS